MKYTEEMILHSPSGYCMPFEEDKNKEVTLSKRATVNRKMP